MTDLAVKVFPVGAVLFSIFDTVSEGVSTSVGTTEEGVLSEVEGATGSMTGAAGALASARRDSSTSFGITEEEVLGMTDSDTLAVAEGSDGASAGMMSIRARTTEAATAATPPNIHVIRTTRFFVPGVV